MAGRALRGVLTLAFRGLRGTVDAIPNRAARLSAENRGHRAEKKDFGSHVSHYIMPRVRNNGPKSLLPYL